MKSFLFCIKWHIQNIVIKTATGLAKLMASRIILHLSSCCKWVSK